MVEFYRRYLFGENISKSEALRQAQLAVIEQLRKKYGAAHPVYLFVSGSREWAEGREHGAERVWGSIYTFTCQVSSI